jgi:hypothetical protein
MKPRRAVALALIPSGSLPASEWRDTLLEGERILGKFSVSQTSLIPDGLNISILMLGNPLEKMPRLVAGTVAGRQGPHLSAPRSGLPADVGEMSEQKPGRLDGIMSGTLSHDERKTGLLHDCDLPWQIEHSAVGRDEAVPWARVMMQSEEYLPIVDVRD